MGTSVGACGAYTKRPLPFPTWIDTSPEGISPPLVCRRAVLPGGAVAPSDAEEQPEAANEHPVTSKKRRRNIRN